MKLTYREAKAILQSHPYILYDKTAVKIAVTLLYDYTGGNKWINPNYVNHIAQEAEAKAAALRGMVIAQKAHIRCRLVRETAAYLERRNRAVGVPVESNSVYQEPTREPINKQAALTVYK